MKPEHREVFDFIIMCAMKSNDEKRFIENIKNVVGEDESNRM